MLLHYRIRICISGHSNFDKDWNLFLQKWFYIKLLIIVFIRMCDAPCWKSNNICNTWKIKEKLKILMTCDDLSFINTTQKILKPSPKNVSIPRMDEKKLHTWEFQLNCVSRNMRCKLLQKRSTGKTPAKTPSWTWDGVM